MDSSVQNLSPPPLPYSILNVRPRMTNGKMTKGHTVSKQIEFCSRLPEVGLSALKVPKV
jgi:hypothetical protein